MTTGIIPHLVNNRRLEGLPLQEALRLSGAVRRFHNHPHVVGSQTVGQHTYNAMAILIAFYPTVPPKRLLLALMVHDLAEGETGDIPAPTKWAYPEMGAILDRAEADIRKRFRIEFEEELNEEEVCWMKGCDILEGLTFSRDQLRLGNKGMADVAEAYATVLFDLRKAKKLPSPLWTETIRILDEVWKLLDYTSKIIGPMLSGTNGVKSKDPLTDERPLTSSEIAQMKIVAYCDRATGGCGGNIYAGDTGCRACHKSYRPPAPKVEGLTVSSPGNPTPHVPGWGQGAGGS